MEINPYWLDQQFTVYTKAANWSEASGVYLFAGLNLSNQWTAYYVGQADSFRTRLATHERWDEAVRLGATHVHAKTVPLAADRDRIEQELIRAFHPPLNTQHRFPIPPQQ